MGPSQLCILRSGCFCLSLRSCLVGYFILRKPHINMGPWQFLFLVFVSVGSYEVILWTIPLKKPCLKMPWVVVGYASGRVLVNPVKYLNVNRYISHQISQSLRYLLIFVFPLPPSSYCGLRAQRFALKTILSFRSSLEYEEVPNHLIRLKEKW